MYNLVQTGHLSKKEKSGYARRYYKKCLNRIGKILKQDDFTEETVHQLRVEIKKIRALFILLHHIDRKFPTHKFYKPFETIFEMAGKTRAVQVEEKLLKEYIFNSSDLYLAQLQTLVLKKSDRLKKAASSDAIAKLDRGKKAIAPFLNKVTEKRVQHFLKTSGKKLNGLLKRKIFKEQDLHALRKHLKSFYFIAKIGYENMIIPEPWSKLLELLGEWHDEQVAIEHLRKAIYSSRFTQDEINRLYVVKREITDNRENLIDQIVSIYFLIECKEGSPVVPDYAVVNHIH